MSPLKNSIITMEAVAVKEEILAGRWGRNENQGISF